MKTKLLVLLVLLCFKISAQKIEDTSLYEVMYSEELQQPLYLNYTVKLCKSESVKYENRKSWRQVDGVVTSDNDDYKGTPYNQSHLAPIMAFKCVNDSLLDLSSRYNCCLMHETLNIGVWQTLEKHEYNLAKNNPKSIVKVSITLIFNDNNKVDGGATIPSYFLKVINVVNQLETDRYVYIFPNDKSVKGKKITDFKVDELSGTFKTSSSLSKIE
jgi:DNA/RNA endonuclease G (NUC1)